ncbi:hypothetical protein JSY36_05220 [Bacillus sp. H-16]|uniref:hypothetical protein n=1 Tax=Alteribacter salitolerans TaxID=2912333 RepID=UPI00196436B7|nr:hypothetical protein [Alteribacter salitolerans]MBM7095153.1 hypothetical protein [Alteribacter salitolerans]
MNAVYLPEFPVIANNYKESVHSTLCKEKIKRTERTSMSYTEPFNNKTATRKPEHYNLDELFVKPLIHRDIKGEKVYQPLDLDRLWNQPK